MEEGEDDKSDITGKSSGENKIHDPCLVPLPILIGRREISHRYQQSTIHQLEGWSEESFMFREDYSWLPCKLPGMPKSTFLMVFSPDGTKVASTHGDHVIYVTDVKTRKCICSLKGHPRTPWSIVFHPTSNNVIASGCLAGEVRVWDMQGGSAVWNSAKKNTVIASVAFHPTAQVLVIAADNEIHFWDWYEDQPFAKISTNSDKEKVRYVKFDPLGDRLITGIANIGNDRCFESSRNAQSNAGNSNSETSLNSLSLASDRLYLSMRNRARTLIDAPNSQEQAPNQEGNSHTGDAEPTSNSTPSVRYVQQPATSIRDNLSNGADGETSGTDTRSTSRPFSDDGASSSSLDSTSSASSSVSASSNERISRLRLLWSSRMNRIGAESDNNSNGPDSEDRRNERTHIRNDVLNFNMPAADPEGIRSTRRNILEFLLDSEPEEMDSDGDSTNRQNQSRPPLPFRSYGGRWMYYRGKYNSMPPPGNDRGSRNISSSNNLPQNETEPSWHSQNTSGFQQNNLPGPSGVASSRGSLLDIPSRLLNDPYLTSANQSQSNRTNPAWMDPHFGVQLLSRHIENMQRICRSLSIPRSLELTRHRHDISRLQQIRSMLYDIQNQIWSLRASVDQTINEDFSDPLQAEGASATNLDDSSVPSQDTEFSSAQDIFGPYSFSTLLEEDPDQTPPSNVPMDLSTNSSSHHSGPSSGFNDLPTTTHEYHRHSAPQTYTPRSNTRNPCRLQRPPVNTRQKYKPLPMCRQKYKPPPRYRPSYSKSLRLQSSLPRSRLNLSAPTNSSEGLNNQNHANSSNHPSSSGIQFGSSSDEPQHDNPSLLVSTGTQSARGAHGIRTPTTGRITENGSESPVTFPLCERVRRRHSGDWQRRLRSNLASNFEHQSASHTNNLNPTRVSTSVIQNAGTSHVNERTGDSQNRMRSNLSTNLEPQASAEAANEGSANDASSAQIPARESSLFDDHPERCRRTGPPTTSLASRIATMLAQQEENSNRSTSLHTGPYSRLFRDASRYRYASRDFSRNAGHTNSLQTTSFPNGGSFANYLHERRMNRSTSRNLDSLVTGRDLAWATLGAINEDVNTMSQEQPRRPVRINRRERYRHWAILQRMAERLRSLMSSRDSDSMSFLEPEDEPPSNPLFPNEQSSSRRLFNPSSQILNSMQSNNAFDRHMHNDRQQIPIHRVSYSLNSFPGPFVDSTQSNGIYQTHRIQVWDFNTLKIPDISDTTCNIVVSKCKINFDASVAVSVDGSILVAIVPDEPKIVKIGVYSLKPKTLGQELYSGMVNSNAICVSISPTMRHLVIGMSSHNRIGIHVENQVIAHLYKLCDSTLSKNNDSGEFQFVRFVKNPRDTRQSSLNCIKWMPCPGQGLIFGSNSGKLFIIN